MDDTASPNLAAKRVEFPVADGPPAGTASIQSITLVSSGRALPRSRWFHVALVHSADAGRLRLLIDGAPQAIGRATLSALPHGDASYLSIGFDGLGGRPLRGALDELRISRHAAYKERFAPPGSFFPREP